MSNSFTQQEFRNALGGFATGITVITTLGKNGQKVGMTANSFNSVSLTPPLILWSIGKNTNCFEDFMAAEAFAVHVLAEDQQDLSNLFATSGIDRFADLECNEGLSGVPILPHYSVCFQCKMAKQYDGGDHIIMTGEVVQFDDNGLQPLVFYRGNYHNL
ncbi:MAG: p-hydroxyphenylacetate 3-hydroxylase, reductase component [Cellvibrionales bacterium UBA7375]|nr:MAG: p-hydroxyphenylacetate 3-hydroxylase, reductase component [Cellvibrionales bacterium UBA7375]